MNWNDSFLVYPLICHTRYYLEHVWYKFILSWVWNFGLCVNWCKWGRNQFNWVNDHILTSHTRSIKIYCTYTRIHTCTENKSERQAEKMNGVSPWRGHSVAIEVEFGHGVDVVNLKALKVECSNRVDDLISKLAMEECLIGLRFSSVFLGVGGGGWTEGL